MIRSSLNFFFSGRDGSKLLIYIEKFISKDLFELFHLECSISAWVKFQILASKNRTHIHSWNLEQCRDIGRRREWGKIPDSDFQFAPSPLDSHWIFVECPSKELIKFYNSKYWVVFSLQEHYLQRGRETAKQGLGAFSPNMRNLILFPYKNS